MLAQEQFQQKKNWKGNLSGDGYHSSGIVRKITKAQETLFSILFILSERFNVGGRAT